MRTKTTENLLEFNIDEGYDFYENCILNDMRTKYAKQYNFAPDRFASYRDWELLGAILTDDNSNGMYGTDLSNHEIKSAKEGRDFEYQYHKKTGEEKLKEDKRANHLFFSYKDNYQNVKAYYVQGEKLVPIFTSWENELSENYSGEHPNQRFRKQITLPTVRKFGKKIFEIQDGKLI